MREKQPHKWEEEIVEVLQELGGEAHYSDIYELVKERGIMHLGKAWKKSIQGCIERLSSDSDAYKGPKDLFYSVNGVNRRSGIWGLRDYNNEYGKNNYTQDDLSFSEGKRSLKKHIIIERNPNVIREAKKKFKKEHNGRLYCEICKFDFSEKYGELGIDFIEGHHIIPVSEMKLGDKTKVEDIAIVCSNCHSMIHRKKPWLTREKLKRIIKE